MPLGRHDNPIPSSSVSGMTQDDWASALEAVDNIIDPGRKMREREGLIAKAKEEINAQMDKEIFDVISQII